MVDNVKFNAVDYDPTGKSDNMVVSTGLDMSEGHLIEAPADCFASADGGITP